MEEEFRFDDEPDKPKHDPQVIGSVIQRFVSDSDFVSNLKKYSIFNHWEEIVGDGISSRAKPEKISRSILYISVANSTWANELTMMSGQLLSKINSYIGFDAIKELRFKVK